MRLPNTTTSSPTAPPEVEVLLCTGNMTSAILSLQIDKTPFNEPNFVWGVVNRPHNRAYRCYGNCSAWFELVFFIKILFDGLYSFIHGVVVLEFHGFSLMVFVAGINVFFVAIVKVFFRFSRNRNAYLVNCRKALRCVFDVYFHHFLSCKLSKFIIFITYLTSNLNLYIRKVFELLQVRLGLLNGKNLWVLMSIYIYIS